MEETTLEQFMNETPGKEFKIYDLKFLVDVNTKICNLLEQVNNNIEYNVRCSRNRESLFVQNEWQKEMERLLEDVRFDSLDLVTDHPVWEWASQLKGVNGALIGLIVGPIRFWPPKTNLTSQENNRERWAHSIGALLTFCGLGSNKSYYNNSRVLEYIHKQVSELIKPGNSYYTVYNRFISLQYKNAKNLYDESFELDDIDEKIDNQAFHNTCILFVKHIYMAVNEALGRKEIVDGENISLLMTHKEVVASPSSC